MGRKPCCAKEGLNRGAWSAREDKILSNYINVHGEGKWRDLPQRAGLKRCGKSCRLRWLNYLRPDIKRGNISMEEEELIIRLHKLLGNRWSLIAGRLPGRTDNEIKNYWNTNLSKRMQGNKTNPTTQPCNKHLDKVKDITGSTQNSSDEGLNPAVTRATAMGSQSHQVIRTKAVRCTKVVMPQALENIHSTDNYLNSVCPSPSARQEENSSDFLNDFDIGELFVSDALIPDLDPGREISESDDNGLKNMLCCGGLPFSGHETGHDNWRSCDGGFQPNEGLDLKSLASFLDSEEDEWIY